MGICRPVDSPAPDVSVIVPTVPERDLSSLDALREQTEVEYEVIVVSDSTLDICEARNRGVEESRADLLAFTDDDTRPPPDWVHRIQERLTSPGIELVEGPIVGKDYTRRVYHGANLGVSNRAFDAVGGFDSRYAGWMDDTVFGWRIETEFGRDAVIYDPELKMSHPPPMRSQPDPEIERRARREFTDRYFSILRQPNSMRGRLFIAVASRTYRFAPGLWDTVL